MAFQLQNQILSYQEALLDHKYIECFHYLLEESSNPKDEVEHCLCASNWLQKLEDVVQLTAVYLEHFKSCLRDWFSHSQEQDLVSEVSPLITPVKLMHYSNMCDVDCSSYVQDELTCIAVDAYDRDSVLRDKPKIHVSLNRTLRVKKTLKKEKTANEEKAMVLASVSELREGDSMLGADSDRIDVVPE